MEKCAKCGIEIDKTKEDYTTIWILVTNSWDAEDWTELHLCAICDHPNVSVTCGEVKNALEKALSGDQ